ncbi:hypothetical protein I4U23_015240 [Adineta vaga]|nr:hypothetical protein I4U23_015240 [Adineta vaga]
MKTLLTFVLLCGIINAEIAVTFPTDCIYGFTNPIYPSFILPPPQPNSPGDVQLNKNNPIRLANGSNLAAGQGCNSRGFSYYEPSQEQFMNTYIDATERNSSIADIIYATNHDQLYVRTIQINHANLASFLVERILKIDLDCNNGLRGCAYFTVGNTTYNSTTSLFNGAFTLRSTFTFIEEREDSEIILCSLLPIVSQTTKYIRRITRNQMPANTSNVIDIVAQNSTTQSKSSSCKLLKWWSSLSPFVQGLILGVLVDLIILTIVLPLWLVKPSNSIATTVTKVKEPFLRWNTSETFIFKMSDPDSLKHENILKQTSQEMVDIIYDTLEIADKILRNAKINYTIICGTMLGSYRHGGQIPWDDDGDIAIEMKDVERLVALKETFADQGFTLDIQPMFGYRIWDPRRTMIRTSDSVPIPFVDIFLIDTKDNRYEVLEGALDLFPGEPLPYGCFQRLVDVPFGHLTLRGMNNDDIQRHLDENFGSDWNKVAWRIFDHVTGDELPKICVALDRPELRRPALHSKYHDENHRINI